MKTLTMSEKFVEASVFVCPLLSFVGDLLYTSKRQNFKKFQYQQILQKCWYYQMKQNNVAIHHINKTPKNLTN